MQHDHDLGLARDLDLIRGQQLRRRRALGWLAGAGAMGLFGCGGGSEAGASSSSGSSSSSGGSTGCSLIPEETAGPYPGDGSNGANALALAGIVRSDIRSSIAGASATAGGAPLTLTLRLVNLNGGCAGLAGYAIYLWHCDREGRYSLYSSGVTNQNYLRGVQETGADGTVTFTTIFPGCYDGRMPHMHFEIFRSLASAGSYAAKLRTSQLSFPVEVCSAVYGQASGYSASVTNLARISFATDNVFADGVTNQLATISGDLTNGYRASLSVGIAA
ncbi:intradiol ring-cleavage dioxygenase [Roseateles violae]|uniref:Intradiol ring-cleavage dioxygenase n=1 Tax=Roseateles violae TaxID=3058042 RepID=A0ABT8DMA5_9BURK|nr:intradiol ring-cleavage dioxygenase [Pelomonas sp. PFR6]MDN3919053.1 intradiol ring-cleavage dioxygenase [Pelomonas sp. PFR6]